ncbi:MAG: hypothetical protein IT423_20395 [Pirellulaceae bacterium]|nr:hypothetical protein [Pirellulaceae bacterium]
MPSKCRVLLAVVTYCLTLVAPASIVWAQANVPSLITLKDGTRIGPGILHDHATISKNSMAQGQTETVSNSIRSIDDDLRVTYFNVHRVANVVPAVGSALEEIVLPASAEVMNPGGGLAIQSVVYVERFNRYGRRIYSVVGPKGRQDILQGITHLTPLYARVQTLRGQQVPYWDQRIATSTISSEALKTILHHELNLDRASDRMRLFRFYLQCERYLDAQAELVDALAKFPELAEQKNLLVILEQALADQMFREIELRRRSGQSLYVSQLLQGFSSDLAGDASVTETQLRVQDQLDQLKATITQLTELVQSLRANLAELPPADAELVRPLIEQIAAEISVESQSRLNDYARFNTQTNLKVDQRLSFAIGGWLLGPGSGLDNFEVAKSVVRVSALVQEYLSQATPARREEILELLSKEEGGRPELVGRIVGAMKPPLTLPPTAEGDPPGLVRMQIPAGENSGGLEYTVQLPPEYNPLRRYPCIVALPGLGSPTERSIDWWCGGFDQQRQQRFGAATRYGYIVVSPKWATDDQLQYNYSGLEHDKVLRCVRDVYRRCSVDTDRVFIAGHFDGGAAAWDIALSHPDLWAGAILLSPSAEKFIVMYGANAAYVPTYTVWGQFDASSLQANLGRTIDDYLKSPTFDALAVEYKGRPRDHFLEEMPRIIEWMEMTNHRRDPNPREIKVEGARAGDRFFYWFEMPEIDADVQVSPVMFDMKRQNKIEVELKPAGTEFLLSKFPAKQAWVWLRPGLVDFGQTVSVKTRTGRKSSHTFKGDNRILLEDVRTRADRKQPFYDRIDVP